MDLMKINNFHETEVDFWFYKFPLQKLNTIPRHFMTLLYVWFWQDAKPIKKQILFPPFLHPNNFEDCEIDWIDVVTDIGNLRTLTLAITILGKQI
jgi:hypothetical protein